MSRRKWTVSDPVHSVSAGICDITALSNMLAHPGLSERNICGRRLLLFYPVAWGKAGLATMRIQQIFDQITREHDAMIKRIASSYEARTYLIEELVQEIYLAIWKALPSFRGESSLRTFVARIATNRAVTHVARAFKSSTSLELSEQITAPGESPETHAIMLDHHSRLISAVRQLPLAYRQTVMLTLEGLKPKEVAEILGISMNAVAIRMSRSKELLRALIGEKT
jgi:RNA polymerase sigma factor (sigma-70 family)